MIRIFYSTVFLYFTLSVAKANSFEIKGEVNLKAGNVKVALQWNNNGIEHNDTNTVVSQKFHFKGNIEYPTLCTITLLRAMVEPVSKGFFLDPSVIAIRMDKELKTFYVYRYASN